MTDPELERQIREAEQAFRSASIPIPEGYDEVGLALTSKGPRMFITGPDVPPMSWCQQARSWEAVINRNVQ